MLKINLFAILLFAAGAVNANSALDELKSKPGFSLNFSNPECKLKNEKSFENILQVVSAIKVLEGSETFCKTNLAVDLKSVNVKINDFNRTRFTFEQAISACVAKGESNKVLNNFYEIMSVSSSLCSKTNYTNTLNAIAGVVNMKQFSVK